MKYLGGILFSMLVVFAYNNGFAQRGLPVSYTKEITVAGKDKDKLYKRAKSWLNSEDIVTITKWNDAEGKIEATATMPYKNDVVVEEIQISPNAALRTKGKITFAIKVTVTNNKVIIEFTNFVHQAEQSRFGQVSFGQVITNDKPPLGKCFEDAKWCNAVWLDMKAKIVAQYQLMAAAAQKKID